MSLLIFILFCFVFCYAGLCYWFVRELEQKDVIQNQSASFVSVIVAAKNEAENISACLDSLIALDYPKDKLEIIIVDDASDDETNQIVSSYVEKSSFLLLVSLPDGQKEKPGKAGALLKGIKKSSGELLFITDADCRVPPTWVKALLQNITPEIGISGGTTILENTENTCSWWPHLQTLELLLLQGVAFVLAKDQRPVSWLGNNLVIRRAAYDEVGGFANLNDTLVEDYALIRAIRIKTQWKSRFTINTNSCVKTKPLLTVKELYNQRKRWASDRKNVPWWGLGLLIVNYATHLFLLLAIFFAPLFITILALLFVLVPDYFVLNKTSTLIDENVSVWDFFGFKILYIFTTCLLPLFFVFGRQVRWKNTTY